MRYWLATMAVILSVGGGVSWSQEVMTTPCTLTTDPPAKSTNFTATVNEEGILLQWDAAPVADKVYKYEILRGEGKGATPTLWGTLDLLEVYDPDTNTFFYPTPSPMDEIDSASGLVPGTTYVYAIRFGRWSNCGGYQPGEQSDTVTVTYQPDE